MLQGFQRNLFTSIAVEQFIGNLIMAFLCGMIISAIYRWTYRGPHYSATYVQSIVILSMITALVIMVIGNNLARAFGLVGAMSIIRFRTAVKDTQDIVFIFFALAAGMAAGVGLRMLSLFGTLLIGTVLVLLHHTDYARSKKYEFLLQFVGRLSNGESPYMKVINQYCKYSQLINTQSIGEEDLYELSFHVKLKDEKKRMNLIQELNQLPEISNVRLFFDEEQS